MVYSPHQGSCEVALTRFWGHWVHQGAWGCTAAARLWVWFCIAIVLWRQLQHGCAAAAIWHAWPASVKPWCAQLLIGPQPIRQTDSTILRLWQAMYSNLSLTSTVVKDQFSLSHININLHPRYCSCTSGFCRQYLILKLHYFSLSK